jgi:hypothetical protein
MDATTAPLQGRPELVTIQVFIDDAKCFEGARDTLWSDVVRCPKCYFAVVTKEKEGPGGPLGRQSAGT